jgi:putative oxidoreductase
MNAVGVDFAYGFWGLMAGSTEFFGGIFLIAGLLVRPVSLALSFVMLIAVLSLYTSHGTLAGAAAHPIEVGIALLALYVIGAGRYSLDQRMGLN